MIILVYGLPGTGKTFFSKHFAAKNDMVHLNTDIIRDKMNFRGKYNEKAKQQVYNELYKHVAKELKNGSDVIVDGTFHKRKRRETVKKIAEEKNDKIYLIEIKATGETVKKRLQKDRRYSEADFAVYLKIRDCFESEEEDHLELLSDDNKVDEMISKVKKYIYI
jgi:predicted kinase